MNIESAKKLLHLLYEKGVKTICLCPGARNAPFVELLNKTPSFEVIGFYDERSAGFFALGRARRDKKPVAVMMTSGTAVAETLPAVIEAYYTETPLVIVSSDRPKRLRGTGAPQAIDQSHIFARHVENSWDISAGEDFEWKDLKNKPYHINICFDEPILDSPIEKWEIEQEVTFNPEKPRPQVLPKREWHNTLVVLGSLEKSESLWVEKTLQDLKVPIFAESTSGLRASMSLAPLLLQGGEKLVVEMLKSGAVKSLIRIGDVPLGRYWRDVDQLDLPIMSLSAKPWSGSSQSEIFQMDLSQLDLSNQKFVDWDWTHWKALGDKKQKEVETLTADLPASEVAFFSRFSQQVLENEFLYLGNSLPVRIWDLVDQKNRFIKSNRGVNGIDGQISTALGWMQPNSKNWLLLGDLTTLYDLSGLWVTEYLKSQNIQVNFIVVNNKGGQIFSRIFKSPLFINEHSLNFKPVAELWGWDYIPSTLNLESLGFAGLRLIEWQPDSEQTEQFWRGYDQIWKL